MLKIVPYLGAYRIMDGQRLVEQHGSKAKAEERLSLLTRQAKAAPAPKTTPKPTPSVDKEPEVPATVEVVLTTTVLDGSIGALAKALATGDYDDGLHQLLAMEHSGKTRRGAVAVIETRIAEVSGE